MGSAATAIPFTISTVLPASPSRPKLARLNTGEKIATLKPIQSPSTLPFHLAGLGSTHPDDTRTATADTFLNTHPVSISRPPSLKSRSGPSSPISINTSLARLSSDFSSPLPSAIEMHSPWSAASAHCGGSPLSATSTNARVTAGLAPLTTSAEMLSSSISSSTTADTILPFISATGTTASSPISARGSAPPPSAWSNSSRSLNSFKRSAFAAPDHLDRLKRSFLSGGGSSSSLTLDVTSSSEYPSIDAMVSPSPSSAAASPSFLRLDDHDSALRRRNSSADYQSSSASAAAASGRDHFPRKPITSASAPPALDPTPIVPSLLYLGPAPTHAAHWAELRALGIKRVLNVAEEVERSCTGGMLDDEASLNAESYEDILYKKVGIRDHVEEERVEDMLREGSAFLSWSFDRAYDFVRELRGGGFVAEHAQDGMDLIAVKQQSHLRRKDTGSSGSSTTSSNSNNKSIQKELMMQSFASSGFARSGPASASVLDDVHSIVSPSEVLSPGYFDSPGSTSFFSPMGTDSQSHAFAAAASVPGNGTTTTTAAATTPPAWAAAAAAMSAMATHSYHASNFAPNIGFVAELRRWETLCEVERVHGSLPPPPSSAASASNEGGANATSLSQQGLHALTCSGAGESNAGGSSSRASTTTTSSGGISRSASGRWSMRSVRSGSISSESGESGFSGGIGGGPSSTATSTKDEPMEILETYEGHGETVTAAPAALHGVKVLSSYMSHPPVRSMTMDDGVLRGDQNDGSERVPPSRDSSSTTVMQDSGELTASGSCGSATPVPSPTEPHAAPLADSMMSIGQ
ncbi:hypothetical protein OC846_001547 [Tilletia horrida]|uniref:Uncharacterized protein n=1 Tax=Tilletia horrida TaxID=155126 RepID=A0AAN6GTJ5_9BASI|nr:hypothetical protein OC846_001547 [Tilletia horrida]